MTFLKNPYEHVASNIKEEQGDCILFLKKLSLRKRFNETEIVIDYWILKIKNIEMKDINALVFMAAQLQQPWLVPAAYFLQHYRS